MPGGHQDTDPRLAQGLQVQPLAWLDLGQHRDIGMLREQRRQCPLGIAEPQVDGDSRITRTQAGQHRHDHVRPIRRHFQTPGEQLAIGFEHDPRLLGEPEHRPGDGCQAGALLRQFHAPCRTTQQGDLVVLFQGLDMPGDRRLADKQPGSGTGKAALAGHGIECAELEQVHCYRPHL